VTRTRRLVAVALSALVVTFGVTAQADAHPKQARTIAKQAKVVKQQKRTITLLRRQVDSLRRSADLDVAGKVGVMTPDQAWQLVPVIAARLTATPYQATHYTSLDDLHDYTSWTFTRSVFLG
jgi:hypothetical protein